MTPGAPGPSHLGTRETANPNRSIPEFLTLRLYHRQTEQNTENGVMSELATTHAEWLEAHRLWLV